MYRGSIVVEEIDGTLVPRPVVVSSVLVAGYTGRDEEAVREHIEELRHAGVDPPPTIPMVFQLSADILTTSDHIIVHSNKTSGEVEAVLFFDGDEWLVSVGSDHTDREIEKTNIARAKETCPKIVSMRFWRLDDVEPHWDKLVLRSWITASGSKQKYQDHPLVSLLSPQNLLRELKHFGYSDLRSSLVFCGTVPTLSGFAFGDSMEIELTDPIHHRSIDHHYFITVKEG